MVELAPRETGKTYLYRNISYYAHVLSGGKATPASLFINLNTGKVGVVGTPRRRGLRRDRQHRLHRPQGPGQHHAGLHAGCQVQPGQEGDPGVRLRSCWSATSTCRASCPTRSTTTCSSRCPTSCRSRRSSTGSTATCPAGRSPRSARTRCQPGLRLHHRLLLRDHARAAPDGCAGPLKSRFELVDTAGTSQGITWPRRARRREDLSGLLKLMYPHGEVTDEQLEELLAAGHARAASGSATNCT